jgi:hypothetical protein
MARVVETGFHWSGNMLTKHDLTRKSKPEFPSSARRRVSPALSRNGAPGRAANGAKPEVIKILQDALNEARRGEIIAAAIVFARPNEDKCSSVSATPGGDKHYLVAACDYLKRDIIAATDT